MLLPWVSATSLGCLLSISSAACCVGAQAQDAPPPTDFRQVLQNMAEFSPDPCGPPYGDEKNWHTADVERSLFDQAAQAVTAALNASPSGTESAVDRAAVALKKMEQMSAEINAAWPEDNRFHFRILDVPPVLVVKMSIRTHETFFAFGVPADAGKANPSWEEIGSSDESEDFISPPSELDLYPLHRGPSGNARFLAAATYSGCAGSLGVGYDAREWNPDGAGSLEQIIKQEGSFGLDDNVPDFPVIGKLQTEGPLITLPYCWFSAIDTWDNPSLCAVDTYDLSGNEVKFHSRVYNRPDLVPIAKAIEYAEKHDYHAVLGYCATPEIARRMVRELSPGSGAEDLHVTRIGNGKERVLFGDSPTYRFEVERRGDRWIVVGYGSH